MAKLIKQHVEKALSSGFLAVTLVWGVAAFVVSVAPVEDSGDFRAAFPSGSSSSVSSSVSSVSSATDICSDGIDNDGDGLIDAMDGDECPSGVHPAADGTCSDGLDNEGDIALDGGDPDCDTIYNICTNNWDDDGDGLIDEMDSDECGA